MMNANSFLAILVAALASVASAETLTIDSIVALSQAGLGNEAIVAKIHGSGTKFDLSTDQMISLKAKGVTGPVLAAMIGSGADNNGHATLSFDSPDPLVPHGTGVYMLDSAAASPKMVKIDATVSNQAKTGGIFGYALTGGIASLSVKAVIQNESARVKANVSRPVFYFFFDESNQDSARLSSNWASGSATTVSAPSEFSLIGLLKKEGRREARVGSANIAGVKTGVLDKDRISFDYELVRPGVYKVMPSTKLTIGEYGFIYAVNGAAAAGAVSARIYDFAVQSAY